MVSFNLTFDFNVSLEQRIGFTVAAKFYEKLFTDDITVNLHIAATDTLNNDQAVGGAVPMFHEVNYGVYTQYLTQDASSDSDRSVLDTMQKGNTVDFWLDGRLVDGNTKIMLTHAQAKALGMTEALNLGDGSAWTRDTLNDPDAVDGYIVINNSYTWSYDFTREAEAQPNTLDFLTMALHEMGHSIGFVSGLDGLLETVDLHSGKTRTEGFTVLDLLRYSDTSATVDNPDGSVSDLSIGQAAYFSLNGGKTSSAALEEGDEYQASHWQRFKNAIGIMDPTLGYQERTELTALDLKAFDVLGWDIDDTAYPSGIDLGDLYNQALQGIGQDFGVGVDAIETAIATDQDWYTLGYSRWWQAFQDQMIELGYSRWWQEFEEDLLELGHSRWWQAFDQPMSELGYSRWWQAFEETVLELGYSRWWQTFEDSLLELGYSRWWQAFEDSLLELGHSRWWQAFEDSALELGYSRWWQQLETDADILQIETLADAASPIYGPQQQDQTGEASVPENSAGDNIDNILVGHEGADLISGDSGDDLIDGAGENDVALGEEGNDIIYGGQGLDSLYGGEGDDFLLGENDADILYGEQGHDILVGGHGDDTLEGGDGRDVLIGGSGQGAFEQDRLTGGEGGDRFILGDTYHSYYMAHNLEDYATVMDFDPQLDIVQLHGSATAYQLEQQGNDLWLNYDNDLIAIFKNTNSFSLSSQSVEFV